MEQKILMKGNEALAEAAVIAGCRFYFAYPITPQNEISSYLAHRMPSAGGTFIQAESELAAISMVIGASAGGGRVMTSSSSPGMSLKQEGISYLAGSELPCVLVNIMRGGPGLGGIAGAQGDYFQATRGGGNGDYRTIVLAPSSAQELAELTIDAFDLADEYRIPVMILADGYLGQISEPVILPKPSGKKYQKKWALTKNTGRSQSVIASIRLFPENGLEKHNLHLQEKYNQIAEDVREFEHYHTEDAEWIIVAYGTTSRVVRKAIDQLRKKNIRVGLFRPKSLWPFPKKELKQIAKKARKILTVEMSLGQMVEDVQLSVNGCIDVDFYGCAGGAVPKVNEIIKRIENYEREN